MTRRVWIAQCLCPQRHAIMAAANEADDAHDADRVLGRALKTTVRRWLAEGVMNPHCGICHAHKATWKYEIGRTRWATMAEAEADPLWNQTAADNLATGLVYGEIAGKPTKH